MHDPDWKRYQAERSRAGDASEHSHTALGDPSRWGARVPLTLQATAGNLVTSPQVIRVNAKDAGYSRAWSVVGNIEASQELWGLLPSGAGPGAWAVALEVTSGVGQNTMVQLFNLLAIVAADLPFYFDAPLVPSFAPFTGNLIRPFVIPGAIVGYAVSMRVTVATLTPGPLSAVQDVVTSINIGPFNPGTHL